MRWRWGDRWIDRGHSSVWYVGFVGIPPTTSAPWLGRGQKSVWPSILEPGKPLKTAKNRIYRLWFTGHWTSTARPDIPDVAVTAIFPVIPTALPHIPFGGGRAAGSVLEKNSTLQFSPTVAPILHETSSPRYQMKGLVTSYRTVTGFGWVGAAAAEICGFSGLLSF